MRALSIPDLGTGLYFCPLFHLFVFDPIYSEFANHY